MDKYVAFIPVRGGSKSIPLKNIKHMNGRPLVYWTLDAAVNCPEIERVYVCTDSDDIKECIESYCIKNFCQNKLICVDRPPETATDTATTESAMLYFADSYKEFENIILIQATSPLLIADDLSTAIHDFETGKFDSMLSVVRQKRFHWAEQGDVYVPTNYDYNNRPRRQEFDGYLVENGAFYINSRKNLIHSQCRLSGKVGVYKMKEETYFEIDEPSDWTVIEQLHQNMMLKSNKKFNFNNIKILLTDCDGVLTDAGMYYSENGDELKKFSTKDGMGIQLLKEKGIKFGIITGEASQLVIRRAEKLKADECFIGIDDKLSVLEQIKQKYGLRYDEIAYIGDDINDIMVLRAVGFSCCPFDAVKEVKQIVDMICNASGGQGVVREVVEYVFRYLGKE